MTTFLSTSYLPPIPYVAACLHRGDITLDKHEHYIKQTHRNRAMIYSANGILPLIIPVQHTNLYKIPVHEVMVANDTSWQKIHWKSIVSAYRNAAFFEYYEEEFAAFYREKILTLFEFNLGLINLIFGLLRAEVIISFTSTYEKVIGDSTDFRNRFDSPPNPLPHTKTSENRYRQVFSGIHGFQPNLSIVDLLFNEGAQSLDYLLLNNQY